MPQNTQPRKNISERFFNNTDPNTLFNRIDDILRKKEITHLDFLIGFFNPCGFNKIAQFLKPHHKIRILIGIEANNILGTTDSTYKQALINFLHSQIKKHYGFMEEKSLDLLISALENNLSIKMTKDKNVHAKIYLFYPTPSHSCAKGGLLDYTGHLITGSSNLSLSGLENNYEFNVELRNSDDIESALAEFEALWDNAVEISPSDIKSATKNTHLDSAITAQDVYYKLLLSYFGIERIRLDESLESLFPSHYHKPIYQIEAVQEGLLKLEKYNGFFLSDVVGLGKTLIASMIAKKLVISHKIKGAVLVLCPPSLKFIWERHFKLVKLGDNRHYKIETHDAIHKIKNAQDFELIIIDESHNFRNNATNRYKKLESICKNKKMILLSATPQNNSPSDLANQIYLFQDKRASTIDGIIHLETFFNTRIKAYKNAKDTLKINHNDKNAIATIQRISEEIRTHILRHIMIRRTRRDLQENKRFENDLIAQNIVFPKIKDPQIKNYDLGESLRKLAIQTLTFLNSDYEFARYGAYLYLTPSGKDIFDEKNSDFGKEFGKRKFYESTAERLQHLMRILLFKRFESSFYAFRATLKSQIKSLESFIKMFENGEVHLPKKDSINLEKFYESIEENTVEDFIKANEDNFTTIEIGYFKRDYGEILKSDLLKIKDLYEKWNSHSSKDPKLEAFLNLLKSHKNRKIVVFSESKDTVNYLQDNLIHFRALCVDSSTREKYIEIISQNFDANFEDKRDDYDIIITTDTLAEGINLHRANIIINYDAPWNATKLMQRIGRINRIGTAHSEILIYNFEPSDLGDKIINLNSTIFSKLQSFHYTLGEDSAIYSQMEEVSTKELYNKDIKSSDDIDLELPFLEEIKALYHNDYKAFQRILGLPNKIQVITENAKDTFLYLKQPTMRESSAESIKVDYFYTTKLQGALFDKEQIDFIDFAKSLKGILKLPQSKESKQKHYDNVAALLDIHNEQIKRLDIEKDRPKAHITNKADQKAIRRLQKLASESKIAPSDKDMLINFLTKGTYSNLGKRLENALTQSDIDKIKRDFRLESSAESINPQSYQTPYIELSFSY